MTGGQAAEPEVRPPFDTPAQMARGGAQPDPADVTRPIVCGGLDGACRSDTYRLEMRVRLLGAMVDAVAICTACGNEQRINRR